MELWARLRHLELTWTGLFLMTGAFVAVLFVRRLLPPQRRHRGRISALFFGAAPVLHLIATAFSLVGLPTVSGTLHLVNILFVVFGAVGVASLIVFDIVLGRTKVPTIARDLSQSLGFVIVLLLVLHSGGIHPLSVLTTSAVVTAIVGLALQSMLANVVAGLVLQLDGTFNLGDWVQWGARVGRIAQINWRSSSIVTRDGDTAIVPNGALLSNEVLNLSRPNQSRRCQIRVSFHHRHSPAEVERAMTPAVSDVAGVRAEPAPTCTPSDFGPGYVTYQLAYWVEDVAREVILEGAVRARIWYAAERAGLEGPCPRPEALPAAIGPGAKLTGDEQAALATRLGALSRVAVFAPLGEDDRHLLASAMRRRRFAAGETILRQGEAGGTLFVVEAGSVRVTLTSDGASADVASLADGECFGEMSLLAGEARSATCVAKAETVCYEIASESFRRVLDVHPQVAEAVSDLLAMRQLTLEATKKGPSAPTAEDAASAKARVFRRMRDYFHLA